MFGKKQIKRTCRACKHERFVPPQMRDLSIPKQPGAIARTFKTGRELEKISRTTDLALSVCLCPVCGSDSYTDKDVRV